MATHALEHTRPSSNWHAILPPPSQIVSTPLQISIQHTSPSPPPILTHPSPTTALNNQYVALPAGSTTYALTTPLSSATKFFVQKFNATNTWAFHNADDTRQLALRGPDGVLLYMVDVTNPNSGNIPGGQLMEWATFTMESSVLGVSDGSTLKSRTFVGVKGTGNAYTLALYDGELGFDDSELGDVVLTRDRS